MSIEKFQDGSILYTGKDIYDALEKAQNKRDNYEKSCSFCIHNQEEELCGDCSMNDSDMCCSCHILPPCSYCVNNAFEPTSYLINFKNYSAYPKKPGKWKWECFPTTQSIYEKYKKIEEQGILMSAEILNEEIVIYLDNDFDLKENDKIELCNKHTMKQIAEEMILSY